MQTNAFAEWPDDEAPLGVEAFCSVPCHAPLAAPGADRPPGDAAEAPCDACCPGNDQMARDTGTDEANETR